MTDIYQTDRPVGENKNRTRDTELSRTIAAATNRSDETTLLIPTAEFVTLIVEHIQPSGFIKSDRSDPTKRMVVASNAVDCIHHGQYVMVVAGQPGVTKHLAWTTVDST